MQVAKVVDAGIQIKVQSPESKQSDLRTAASLKKALTRNAAVTEDKIQVRLDDGWVYIRIQA